MEKNESEYVVEIPGTLKDDIDSVAKEWLSYMKGDKNIKRPARVWKEYLNVSYRPRKVLQTFCLSTRIAIDDLYNEMFEIVHDARKCYIDGSTDAYSNHELCQMMLQDGCFIVFFMEGVTIRENSLHHQAAKGSLTQMHIHPYALILNQHLLNT
ncbi:hypothetical protein L1987_77487 [Smallanthus sonchifolius]|uniref:Uncharacterized protein n=1 Tax=Smallanthus sonchifolius TaxID=185202 RepID=A0ACB8ZA02_9ASTR|nr:hypothetical protein L1987_77487 [Smallanthus sonchifolius]